jgi:hypothetical protein
METKNQHHMIRVPASHSISKCVVCLRGHGVGGKTDWVTESILIGYILNGEKWGWVGDPGIRSGLKSGWRPVPQPISFNSLSGILLRLFREEESDTLALFPAPAVIPIPPSFIN